MKILETSTPAGFNMATQVRVRELAPGEPSPAGASPVDDAAPVFDWLPARDYTPYQAAGSPPPGNQTPSDPAPVTEGQI